MPFRVNPLLPTLVLLAIGFNSCADLDAAKETDITGYQKVYVTDLKLEVWTPPEFKTYRSSTLAKETLNELKEQEADEHYVNLVRSQFRSMPPKSFLMVDTLNQQTSFIVFPLEEYIPIDETVARQAGQMILQQAEMSLAGTDNKMEIINASLGSARNYKFIKYDIHLIGGGTLIYETFFFLSHGERSVGFMVISTSNKIYSGVTESIRMY